MSSDVVSGRRRTAAIIGDSALFTAVTVVAGPLSLIIGPAAAWWLHGRRVNRAAAIAGAIGLLVGIVAVGGIFLMFPAIGAAVGPVGGSEFTYAIVLLAAASIVFLAGVVALDIDAVRDLAHTRRNHIRLDIARLVSTLIVALAVVAVTVIQATNPATEIGDAGVFALFAGAVGAITMWVGGMIHARLEKSADAVQAVRST